MIPHFLDADGPPIAQCDLPAVAAEVIDDRFGLSQPVFGKNDPFALHELIEYCVDVTRPCGPMQFADIGGFSKQMTPLTERQIGQFGSGYQ